jgi:DNA-binding CsgD family transcriptional regulator/PAS domain-containing protein
MAGQLTETEQFSALVGDLYDAAVVPALWPEVLGKIADFVEGQSAALLTKDLVSTAGNAHYTFGCDPHYLQLFLDGYWRFDPTTPLLYFAPDQVASIADLMPYEDYLETRFHQEWARPQGWVDWISAVLEKSATSFAFMTVVRKKGSGRVDEEVRGRMQLVVPHVRRAVVIGKVIDLKTAEATTFADTLDGLSTGMFLVDANGRIVHANAAARCMLAAGEALHAGNAKLVAEDPRGDQLLRDVLAAAALGDAAVGTDGIAIPLSARDGDRYVAHVLPLTSGARQRTGTAYKAAAAVFIRKAMFEAPSTPELIAETYKLTPMELRVLLALIKTGGISEIAETLGIAETTVKSHLGQVYAKTGAKGHADLVKLMAGYTNPLMN